MAGITVTPVTVAAKAVLPRIIRTGVSAAPTLRVLVDFSGTEVDIASDVRRVTISRGRSRERETMSPGRADIDIWNEDGRYDPDNYSSPYYPNIRPNKPVRILAVTDTGTVPVFDGRLEGSTLNYAEGGLQPTVLWRAIDASKRLNRDRSTTGYGTAGQLTGARVAAVLDGATPAWAASERTLAPGTNTVQYSAGDQGRYDYLVQVAESEPGAFFISADGKAVFRDANWAPAPASPALGNATGEFKFSSIEITDDESEIYNAVTVTASSLTDQVEEDFSSEAEFGRSDLSVSSLLDTLSDMDDLALTYLVAYSSPRRRISSLKVDRVAADWYWFLSKELMDRVTVRHRPIYGGTFAQSSAIQGIQLAVNDSQNWELTWNLSPPLDIISNPNLLTEDQASIETSASGWYVSFTESPPGNGVVIDGRTAGPYAAYVGSYGLALHTYGVAAIQGAIRTTPYTTAAAIPTHTYRASAWVRDAGWLTDYWYVRILFYNSGGTIIAQTDGGAFGPYFSGSAEWQQGTCEAVAPTGAAYVTVELVVVEYDSGGHSYFVDAVELRDTLVLASVNPQPATIARAVTLPAPNILTTPQNRTVTPPTIARAAALPAPTVVGGTSFVPTDISGGVAWLDFNDLSKLWQTVGSATTAVSADSQPIGYVQDKSGAAHHFTAVSSTQRPLVRTGANGINGKSIAQLDGVDDYFVDAGGTGGADATLTFFIVAKKRSAPSGTSRVLHSTTSGSTDWTYANSAISASGYVYDVNEAGGSRVLGGTATNVNVIALRYNSSSSVDYWINGGAKANFDPDDSYSAATTIVLGVDAGAGTGFGDYNVGEFIRYNSPLTLTDVNRVGVYLAAKWGFTWTTAT